MTSPTTAVNTASNITRGFMSARKAHSRVANADCVSDCRRDRGSAAISISSLLSARDLVGLHVCDHGRVTAVGGGGALFASPRAEPVSLRKTVAIRESTMAAT